MDPKKISLLLKVQNKWSEKQKRDSAPFKRASKTLLENNLESFHSYHHHHYSNNKMTTTTTKQYQQNRSTKRKTQTTTTKQHQSTKRKTQTTTTNDSSKTVLLMHNMLIETKNCKLRTNYFCSTS